MDDMGTQNRIGRKGLDIPQNGMLEMNSGMKRDGMVWNKNDRMEGAGHVAETH